MPLSPNFVEKSDNSVHAQEEVADGQTNYSDISDDNFVIPTSQDTNGDGQER